MKGIPLLSVQGELLRKKKSLGNLNSLRVNLTVMNGDSSFNAVIDEIFAIIDRSINALKKEVDELVEIGNLYDTENYRLADEKWWAYRERVENEI